MHISRVLFIFFRRSSPFVNFQSIFFQVQVFLTIPIAKEFFDNTQ